MASVRGTETPSAESSTMSWRDVRPSVVGDEGAVAVRRESLLAQLRRRAGLTQKALAEQMGVSQARVSAIEGNDVAATEVATLIKYASALGGKLKIVVVVGGDEQAVLG
jgi:DNA-binding XRE family transcriptional regulator